MLSWANLYRKVPDAENGTKLWPSPTMNGTPSAGSIGTYWLYLYAPVANQAQINVGIDGVNDNGANKGWVLDPGKQFGPFPIGRVEIFRVWGNGTDVLCVALAREVGQNTIAQEG